VPGAARRTAAGAVAGSWHRASGSGLVQAAGQGDDPVQAGEGEDPGHGGGNSAATRYIPPPVVGSHPGHVTHKGLAEQQPGRVEAVSDRASGAEHLMRLGLIGAARLVQAERGVQASAGPR